MGVLKLIWKSKNVFIILMLFALTFLTGCGGGTVQEGYIEGYVYKADSTFGDGALIPVSEATVQVVGTSRVTKANNNGYFRIYTNPGHVELVASKGGWTSPIVGVSVKANTKTSKDIVIQTPAFEVIAFTDVPDESSIDTRLLKYNSATQLLAKKMATTNTLRSLAKDMKSVPRLTYVPGPSSNDFNIFFDLYWDGINPDSFYVSTRKDEVGYSFIPNQVQSNMARVLASNISSVNPATGKTLYFRIIVDGEVYGPVAVTPLGIQYLVSPGVEESGVNRNPTLEWSTNTGADYYFIRLYDKVDYTSSDLVYSDDYATFTSTRVNRELADYTTHIWYVAAVNEDQSAVSFSKHRKFTTGPSSW